MLSILLSDALELLCGPSLGSSSVASNEIKLQNFSDRVQHKETGFF